MTKHVNANLLEHAPTFVQKHVQNHEKIKQHLFQIGPQTMENVIPAAGKRHSGRRKTPNGAERVPENIEKTMPEKRSAPGCSPGEKGLTRNSLFG